MENYLELLSHNPIFLGVKIHDIKSMLNCLAAVKKNYVKDSYILMAGEATSYMGLLLTGNAFLIQEDLWGYRNIIAKINPGEVFAESFAASPGTLLTVSVVANENCEILFLDINRVMSICPSACAHHTQVVRNLVSVLSNKALALNDKISHISKHSTKEKLLSYLSSESLKQGKLVFDIPYNRQQLADYLCVERAAMTVELSKLRKDGTIDFKKNHFTLFLSSEINSD